MVVAARAQRVEAASGAVFVAAIAMTPWLRTPVTGTRVQLITLVLLIGLTLWAWACWTARRRPMISLRLAASVGLALTWGWFLAANARTVYDPTTGTVRAVSRRLPGWPGAIDRHASVRVLGPITVLAIAAFAVRDLADRPVFRRALVWALAIDGAALGILGTLDRFGIGPTFPRVTNEGSHFGPFAYHGNAAAFVNLCLPAAFVLVVICVGGQRRVAVALLCGASLGAIFHVSKIGLVLSAVLVAVLGRQLLPSVADRRRLPRSVAAVAVGAVGVVALAANRHRWQSALHGPDSASARVEVWRVAWDVWLRAKGGLGPGGFKVAFPGDVAFVRPSLFRHWIVTPWAPGRPTSLWMYVHSDPLQFLVEWGLPGVVLMGGGVWFAVQLLRRSSQLGSPLAAAGRAALIVVAIHSLVDFPLQVPSIQLAVIAWLAVVASDTAPRPTSDLG